MSNVRSGYVGLKCFFISAGETGGAGKGVGCQARPD